MDLESGTWNVEPETRDHHGSWNPERARASLASALPSAAASRASLPATVLVRAAAVLAFTLLRSLALAEAGALALSLPVA